ncbi:MAG: TraR/DksA family transcriptional regulator [Planctomycetes bacterium]|jgi:RNA polymerase-binding protein DksA|nr:TraR/DksA family transcriptional regulator [Planctomycetota bacterium]
MSDAHQDEVLDLETLQAIKKDLLMRREQLSGDLNDISTSDYHEADNRVAKFPEYGDKPDENAQEVDDYATTIVAEKILEDSLEDIDAALKRIENKTYGTCKYCQKPINKKRLLARPTASSCVECKTKLQNS